MNSKPRRWFVIPVGDDVNSIIARNFPDADLHSEIHIQIRADRFETKPAWEILPSQLEALSTFLVTEHFKITPLVAVQVDGQTIRYARREEYDTAFRRKQKRQQSVNRDARKKASPPAKKPIARMVAKKRR
jgi:hypothetical protein